MSDVERLDVVLSVEDYQQ